MDEHNRTALWYTASCTNDTGKEIYNILNRYKDERCTDQYDVIKDVWEAEKNATVRNLTEAAKAGCSACCREYIE